jgi:hypothetical protein
VCVCVCACARVQSISSSATLSASYISMAQNMCQSQIALAGYRLAQLLDTIFGDNNHH